MPVSLKATKTLTPKIQHLSIREPGICLRTRKSVFACHCQQDSPARSLALTPGATVFIAPKGLLSNWQNQCEQWIDSRVAKFDIITVHKDSKSRSWLEADLTKYGCEQIPSSKDLKAVVKQFPGQPYWTNSNWSVLPMHSNSSIDCNKEQCI